MVSNIFNIVKCEKDLGELIVFQRDQGMLIPHIIIKFEHEISNNLTF